jgi:hypothetical protein
MLKVSPASLQTFIELPNCVLEDRVQYSTVHIPNVFCDGHLQLINCVGTEFFIAPQRKKPGGERSGDLGGQMVLEMILSANTSSKSAIDMCCMSRSDMLLKVGFVNFIFFQLRNEGIHNIVTVPL